ncbi:thiamine biosynthesis protein ThiS [Anaerobacillus alkalidiazotrophicus]|uniref:Thiamine biosynthesis protein ThiS n=1 Tax=Anaerobacillus alkalidiazotrophicus TaxID=472963 RepID=A0A1S2M6M0_9BACI|nr:sulfur carrier protein ThiS [Anaerobacillus alkalidiazotrophicus]OIJ20266.1 thiamine biosynthesis protein ThiS [Anaerobacillus alkalidiazotrophicus]
MNVIINGEKRELQLETLKDVIEHFHLDENLVVTEVNGEIVDCEERANTLLQEGMRIEIVQFVGGG